MNYTKVLFHKFSNKDGAHGADGADGTGGPGGAVGTDRTSFCINSKYMAKSHENNFLLELISIILMKAYSFCRLGPFACSHSELI